MEQGEPPGEEKEAARARGQRTEEGMGFVRIKKGSGDGGSGEDRGDGEEDDKKE